MDNTFFAEFDKKDEDYKIFDNINVEERAEKYNFEKINNLILCEDRKINELKGLGEGYDMQNEEIQGEYLQLSNRKKFFPYKDQYLRNFSIVLGYPTFKNDLSLTENLNIEKILNLNLLNFPNSSFEFKNTNIFNKITNFTSVEDKLKNILDFSNVVEIEENLEENSILLNKNKINLNLLKKIRNTDRTKLLKNFQSSNNKTKILDNRSLFVKNQKIYNSPISTDGNFVDIKITYNNFNFKDKLNKDVIKEISVKKNIENYLGYIFNFQKFINEKIIHWSKKAYNDNDDEDNLINLPTNKKKFYSQNNKFKPTDFNNYFVSLFEKDIKNNNKDSYNKNNNLTNKEEINYNYENENSSPQLFNNISLSTEKILEILCDKKYNLTNPKENIDYNLLDENEKELIFKLNNLKELELKCENITNIENFFLFKNLKKIDLGSNQLGNLQFILNLDNDKNNNDLINKEINSENAYGVNIEINIFKSIFIKNKFEQILELNFCQNKIKKIEKEVFEKLTNLRILNLEINEITKIENLENCHFLNYLNLNYNKIDQIENLDNLINLEKLYLIGNLIKKIENLSKLKKLKYLSLGINKLKDIENIENEIFYLEELTLFKNKIKNIPENFSLPFLKFFYLNSNKIKQIGNIFLPNLEELYLQNNKIFSINSDSKIFQHTNKLKKIDISFNKLESFSDVLKLLIRNKNIQVLTMNNNPFYVHLNKIVNIENSLVKIFPNLKKIDFDNLLIKSNKIKINDNQITKIRNKFDEINVKNVNISKILNNNFVYGGSDKNLKFPNEEFINNENFSERGDNTAPINIFVNQIYNYLSETKQNIYTDTNKNNSLANDSIEKLDEENFVLFFEILNKEKKQNDLFNKTLQDLFFYFNNQHTNFLNIFNSKFTQISFFGKNLSFNKDISIEKSYLLDLFNIHYSKSKKKFLCLINDIIKNKNNSNIKFIQAKLNESNINEENFKKYIFNLKNILEFLSNSSNKFTNNFKIRKRKILKIQNLFRGFKYRNFLRKNFENFDFLKHNKKILKIQNAFRQNYFRKKFLKNYNKLKFDEDNNFDDNNIQNFFLDDCNINIEDTYLVNLDSNPIKFEGNNKLNNLNMSIIKEEPELEKENKNFDILKKDKNTDKDIININKSEKEIVQKIKNLEKSLKVNEKLENENKLNSINNFENQKNNDRKISYNLNIGLSSGKLNPITNNNINFIENKLNNIRNKNNNKINILNKHEGNFNVVNMNNIDFLSNPLNSNEIKIISRENNPNNIQLNKLPQIKGKNSNNITDNINNINNNNFQSLKLPKINNSNNPISTKKNLSSTSESEESVNFSSNLNLNKKNKESNSLTSSNENFSVKNYSHVSNKDDTSYGVSNISNRDESEKSCKKSTNIYIGGRLLPTKTVEAIRFIEQECRISIKNAKIEWNLQNPLAEELLIKKIKKQYKKKIEKLIQNSNHD